MKEIGQISAEIGKESYAVGGLVRDFLLNIPSDDLDITSDDIDALSYEIKKKGGKIVDKQSDRFMSKIIYYRGLKIDLVAPRKESYTSNSIKPSVNQGTFNDDAHRRDFTVNALYFDLHPDRFMNVVDLTGTGIYCLNKKILDTPLDPIQTFKDDPSRMLRGVRFAATKGFNLSHRVMNAIYDLRQLIFKVPFEIIHNEILKGAVSPDYFRVMDEVGLTDVLFPEVTAGKEIHQIPEYHTQNVYEHILRTTEELNTNRSILRIATFLHDIGKVPADDGTGHFYEHIPKGVPLAEEILRKYKFSNNEIKYVKKMIRHHHDFHNLMNTRLRDYEHSRTLRRIVTRFSNEFIQDLLSHTRADILSDRPQWKNSLRKLNEIEDAIDVIQLNIAIENSKEKLTVNGYDIMDLGYEGPEIGRIKHELQNLVDEGIIPNNRETLLAKLQEFS